MVKHYQFSVLTDDEYSYHYIGDRVKEYVKESGVTSGIVTTVVAHTNCGIVVTEPLECIMDDFKVLLHKLVDNDVLSISCVVPARRRIFPCTFSAHLWAHQRKCLWPSEKLLDREQLYLPHPEWQHGDGRRAGDHLDGI